MSRNENPHLPDDFVLRMNASFPDGHPAREQPQLTQVQAFAFPVLLWLFDQERNRGQGRTRVLAHVAIELARRGQRVMLDDLSGGFQSDHGDSRRSQHFMHEVAAVCKHDYPDQLFEIRQTDRTLRYVGRRPR